MGIKSIFQPGRRELTGVTAQNLYISDFFHKAGINVNEQGTTASAASGNFIPPKENDITCQLKFLQNLYFNSYMGDFFDDPFYHNFYISERVKRRFLFIFRSCRFAQLQSSVNVQSESAFPLHDHPESDQRDFVRRKGWKPNSNSPDDFLLEAIWRDLFT